MIVKRKPSPQNPLVYLWNEFLFARSFEFTTTLSPEVCETVLRGIAHPVQGSWFWGSQSSKTVDIQPDYLTDGRDLRFDIRLKRQHILSSKTGRIQDPFCHEFL